MEGDELDGHALLVGSPGETLKGVDHDVRCMAEMLRKRRFAVDVRTGDRATREGILAGYDALIAKVRPAEAAVFYYSGHGFQAFEKIESTSWQGISPVDLSASTTDDFRGITAWELSIKQAQLTERTKNVTVILDCCYASQMSRDVAVRSAVPKALPHPIRLGFAAHLRALRAHYGTAFDAVDPRGNPDAVRVVACGQTETAFEYLGADRQYRSAFTDALLEVLKEVDGVPVSWAAIESAIRGLVLRRFPIQRPDIEGPVRRRLFSLDEAGAGEGVTIAAISNGFRLGAGRLMGVMPGDIYGVMPPGRLTYRAADVIAEVRVCETSATFANAKLRDWKNGHSVLPRGAIAVPAEKTAVRRAVRIDVPSAAQEMVAEEVAATRTLRLAEPDEAAPLATLRLTDGALTIEDPVGPLFPATRFPEDLKSTIKNLANLGTAQGVRELEGEHGVRAADLEIEWGAIDRGQMRRMPDRGGALALRDSIYVRITSKAPRPLFAHIFNIGLRGTITLLTDFAPAGVELTREQPEFVLGRRGDGTLQGFGVSWPAGMPREAFPRIDELVVIITSTRASLRNLETVEQGVVARGASAKLQDLLAQLQNGLTRDTRSVEPIDSFFVKRLWYFLYPQNATMADIPFWIDDNPLRQVAASAPDAWLTPNESATVPSGSPGAISIQISDFIVENTRLLSSDIRVDVLVCTRSTGEAAGHAAWTRKFHGVKDGERLDLDRQVVFHRPVHDFVDIYLWVSRDTDGSLELAQLLADPELDDTAGALLMTTGDRATPWIDAIGGSAVLSRTAYELLGGAGKAIGIYRTSFLARNQFGVGRHPVAGCHCTEEISLSLQIDPVEI